MLLLFHLEWRQSSTSTSEEGGAYGEPFGSRGETATIRQSVYISFLQFYHI